MEHHDDRHWDTWLGSRPRLHGDVEFVAALPLITHIAGKLERRAARNAGLGRLHGSTGRHAAGFDPANGLSQAFARLSTALVFRTFGLGAAAFAGLDRADRRRRIAFGAGTTRVVSALFIARKLAEAVRFAALAITRPTSLNICTLPADEISLEVCTKVSSLGSALLRADHQLTNSTV